MPVIQCYVDDATLKILEQASSDTGREIVELAEAAIANEAISFKVGRMMARETSHDRPAS